MEFLIFAAVLLIALICTIYKWHTDSERRMKLFAWSQSKGLEFDSGKTENLDWRFSAFQCLQQGSNRYALNAIQGNWGKRPYLSFDFHYETESEDSKGHTRKVQHEFSAVILSSEIPLKSLSIRREKFTDKVAEFFGHDDIDFESAEFSRKFYVKSPDKKWAYDVIHQRTMEFLLSQPDFSIEFGVEHVIAWRDKTFAVEEFEQAACLIEGLLDRLPDYLVRQQRDELSDR